MTTRLMLISDIHGDDEALEAAVHWSKKLGCDTIWCAGDLVEYGPNSTRTVELARAHGIVCVRGNHDRWAAKQGACDVDGPMDDRGDVFDRTREHLSTAVVTWLRELPMHVEASLEGVSLSMWHSWPKRSSDMEFLFHDLPSWALRSASERAEADILIVGHTHSAYRIACPGNRQILCPGTLLRQRLPGERQLPTASMHGVFGVLELPSRRFTVRSVQDGEPVEHVERTIYRRTEHGPFFVQKAKPGRYRACVDLGGVRYSRDAPTREEAEELLRDLRERLCANQGPVVPLLEAWMRTT